MRSQHAGTESGPVNLSQPGAPAGLNAVSPQLNCQTGSNNNLATLSREEDAGSDIVKGGRAVSEGRRTSEGILLDQISSLRISSEAFASAREANGH